MSQDVLARAAFTRAEEGVCEVISQRPSCRSLYVLAIGAELLAVKKALSTKEQRGAGAWSQWLVREFEWNERTAQWMIAAARRFKSDKLSDLSIEPAALDVLAKKKTPDRVVEQALELARTGETITHAKAKALIQALQAQLGKNLR
jgi:hypothetical protein